MQRALRPSKARSSKRPKWRVAAAVGSKGGPIWIALEREAHVAKAENSTGFALQIVVAASQACGSISSPDAVMNAARTGSPGTSAATAAR
jgi:hypothetical protein